jgi:hypothetical protein
VTTEKWKPCQISLDAHRCLRLVSAVTGRDMRSLASEAIIQFCEKALRESGLAKRKK